MRTIIHFLLTALIAAAAAYEVYNYEAKHHAQPQVQTEYAPESPSETAMERSITVTVTGADQPAFDRVMRSNTLRCGYIVLPPEFTKDPNSGQFGGVAYDIAEAMAKSLHLKLEWAEEVNFANLTEGLETKRYDAVCFPLYLGNIAQARAADFTTPFYFTGSGIFVRSDDDRFNNDLSLINAPNVTVSTLDGEMSQTIRTADFPNTKDFSIPQSGDISMLLEAVQTGKADVTFADQLVATPYLKANPGKLRDLVLGNPIRFHGHGFAVAKGEVKLANTLSMELKELDYSGEMDKILLKDGMNMPSILRPAKPYATLK